MPKLKPKCPRKTKNTWSPWSQSGGWKGKRTMEEKICNDTLESGDCKVGNFRCADKTSTYTRQKLLSKRNLPQHGNFVLECFKLSRVWLSDIQTLDGDRTVPLALINGSEWPGSNPRTNCKFVVRNFPVLIRVATRSLQHNIKLAATKRHKWSLHFKTFLSVVVHIPYCCAYSLRVIGLQFAWKTETVTRAVQNDFYWIHSPCQLVLSPIHSKHSWVGHSTAACSYMYQALSETEES